MSGITQDELDSRSLDLALDLVKMLHDSCEREGKFSFLIAICALAHAANLIREAARQSLCEHRLDVLFTQVERYVEHIVRDFDVCAVPRQPSDPLAMVLPKRRGAPS